MSAWELYNVMVVGVLVFAGAITFLCGFHLGFYYGRSTRDT